MVCNFFKLTGLNWNDLPLDNRFNESFSHEYHLGRENIYSKELNLPTSRRVKRAVVRPILSKVENLIKNGAILSRTFR